MKKDMKKITISIPDWKFPDYYDCEECNNKIEDGDEGYWHGNGTYTCSLECAKKFEGIS